MYPFRTNLDRDLLLRVEEIRRLANEDCWAISKSRKGVSLAARILRLASAGAPRGSQAQFTLLHKIDEPTLVFLANSCASAEKTAEFYRRFRRQPEMPDSEEELIGLGACLKMVRSLFELEQLCRKAKYPTAEKICTETIEKILGLMSEVVVRGPETPSLPFRQLLQWDSKDNEGPLKFLRRLVAPRSRYIVYLVHGTWGRGILRRPRQSFLSAENARWFEDGSRFRQRLVDTFTVLNSAVEFREFHWSGKNSFIARHQASLALAQAIAGSSHAKTGQQHPPDVAVIAHSHGGNVALRATGLLPPDHPPIRLVTLATPFLGISSLAPELQGRALRWLYLCLILIYLDWFFEEGFGPLLLPWRLAIWERGQLLGYCVLMTAMAIPAVVLTYKALRLSYRLWRPEHRLTEVLDPRGRLEALQQRVNMSLRHQDRLLILRGTADEASLVMAFSTIVARVSATLGEMFSRRGSSLVLNAILFAGLSSFGINFLPAVPEDVTGFERLAAAVSAVLGPFALLCLAARLLNRLFSLAFGIESWRLPFFSEVTARETPNANDNLTIFTLPPQLPGEGLRHAVYDQPDCGLKLVAWLVGRDREDYRDWMN